MSTPTTNTLSELRNTWVFSYPGSDVLAAAQRRATFHRERETYWSGEFERIRQSLPEGVEIDNGPDKFMSHAMSTGYGTPSLRLKPDVQRAFQQAISKVQHHRAQRERYERWVAVLPNDRSQMFGLTIADVEFFSMHDPKFEQLAQDDVIPDEVF